MANWEGRLTLAADGDMEPAGRAPAVATQAVAQHLRATQTDLRNAARPRGAEDGRPAEPAAMPPTSLVVVPVWHFAR